MRTAQPLAEPLEAQLYTFDELRWRLAKFRGSKLPPSTLRDWLKVLRIQPNEFGMYELSDLHWLIRYAQWLKRGGTSKGFQAIQEKRSFPMPVNLNGSHNKATERPRQIAKADLVQQLGLTEAEFDAQCAQWRVAIEAEYNAAQVAALKDMFGKSSSKTSAAPPPARPIAPQQVQATQAQESAAKTLNLAVQSKTAGLNEAAQRGATQAIEEVTTEFTAYANVLLQGTEAMTQAQAALRQGLKQATTQNAVAVDFSDFFHLSAPAQPVLEGDN